MTNASPDTIRLPPAAPVLRAAAALAWTLAVAYSLAPFDFSLAATRDGAAGASAAAGGGLLDALLHATAFFVVGLLDRLGFPGRRTLPAIGAVPVRGLLLCAAIEAGQLFVRSRHPALLDAFVNVAALALGGWAAPGAASHARAATVRHRSRWIRWAALGAWGLGWSALILAPARLVTLDDWDVSFPLIVGNEAGAERPWDGAIEFVGIYGRALEPGDVRALHAAAGSPGGDPRREALGLLAGYDFRAASGSIVTPTGALSAAPSLRLSGAPGSERKDSGAPLRLEGGAMARSGGGAGPLTRALAAANAFTVEVWCRPSRASQTGPARIVGISNGPFTRNFTIGHEGRSLEFRVRNRLNGPNGMEHALQSPPVLQAERMHVVAVYARGTSAIFIDGERIGGAVDLRQPSVLLGLGPTRRAAAVVALIAGLALLLIDAAFPTAAVNTGTAGLLAGGYALLAPSLALAPFVRQAADIYLWLAPALIAARFVVNRGRP